MLYRLLKGIVWLGIRLYYREVKIVNKHYLNFEGPAIIIANHPNTLMDAWMMGYVNDRRVYFMAKATFFSSPLKRKLLHALGMIPINRKSDAAIDGVSNKDSFEACYKLLEAGDILVVFPEGTSFLERKLRELKSGTARIALEVEKRNKGNLGLHIIPIGINYIDASSYRGKAMLHVGKPFKIDSNLLTAYSESQGKAAKALTDQFRVALSRVFVSLESTEKENLAEDIAEILDVRKQGGKRGVNLSISILQQISTRLDEIQLVAPYQLEEVRKLTLEIQEDLLSLGVRSDLIDRKYRATMYSRQLIQSILFLTGTFPLFVFGFLHNFIPYNLIDLLVRKMTKEEEYHAPLSILLSFVIYPINYTLFIIGFTYFQFDFWIDLIYGLSLPIVGIFAHFYLRYWQHIGSKYRFSQMVKKRKDNFAEIKAQKEQLKHLILGE